MTLHPRIRAILDAQAAACMRPFSQLTPAEARAERAALQAKSPPRAAAPVGSVEDIAIAGADGPIRVRRYRPANLTPAARIVYFHGGGWVMGDIESTDPLCRALTIASECEVLSVDYRLAPEAPFPAAIDDGWAVIRAIVAQDALPVIVGGDSAGGNIATALTLRARQEGAPPIAGQILFYPVTDHDFARGSYLRNGSEGYFLTTEDMGRFWGHYIADPAARTHQFASPLRAEHHRDLPPAFIVVAGFDPLFDEGVAYARALEEAGVPVTLQSHDDMTHGFCSFIGVVDVADTVVRAAGSWAREIAATAEKRQS